MDQDIREITLRIERAAELADRILAESGKVLFGQRYMMERLLVGLFANGHVLLEGVPGLAKTLAIKTLAATMQAKFQRIQFTPDLLPADLVGTLVYNQRDGQFTTRKGPIFANFVLADEINRAPAKVQSALLEAMQERQVTIGDHTFPLPEPFLVLATQNPIEQEGTYPLPEAQVDRFMLKVHIDYPKRDEEAKIMRQYAQTEIPPVNAVVVPDEVLKIRKLVEDIYVDPKIENYVLDIVFATRHPEQHKLADLKPLIQYGASPRASIYLIKAARAHAFIRRRGYVVPEDIRAVGLDVLRHRVMVSYEAEAEEVTSEDIVNKIFNSIEVP
ncbi:AAA family ATPase [candidate division KSB1 bacterium]|nr:MAG: AAA family ATPase [candidate division KSB1 bacterium]